MTETAIVAIVGSFFVALPPTVVALASLRQSKKNEIAVVENTALTKETSAKADSIIVKADEIHELTNSNLADMKNQLAVAMMQIRGLESLVTRIMGQRSTDEKMISDAADASMKKTIDSIAENQTEMTHVLDHDRRNRKVGSKAMQDALNMLLPPGTIGTTPEPRNDPEKH